MATLEGWWKVAGSEASKSDILRHLGMVKIDSGLPIVREQQPILEQMFVLLYGRCSKSITFSTFDSSILEQCRSDVTKVHHALNKPTTEPIQEIEPGQSIGEEELFHGLTTYKCTVTSIGAPRQSCDDGGMTTTLLLSVPRALYCKYIRSCSMTSQCIQSSLSVLQKMYAMSFVPTAEVSYLAAQVTRVEIKQNQSLRGLGETQD